MFSADVASRITHTEPVANDGVSNKSAKFFEHAANISLWALKIVPSQNSVTSVSVSVLKRFEKADAKFEE